MNTPPAPGGQTIDATYPGGNTARSVAIPVATEINRSFPSRVSATKTELLGDHTKPYMAPHAQSWRTFFPSEEASMTPPPAPRCQKTNVRPSGESAGREIKLDRMRSDAPLFTSQRHRSLVGPASDH